MNDILKKRIEEAAVEHAESIPQSDERKEYSREDFIAGAEYALSNQWISVKEALPEYDEAVIVATGHPFYSFCHRSNKPNVQTDKDGWCNYTGMKILAWLPIPKFETRKK